MRITLFIWNLILTILVVILALRSFRPPASLDQKQNGALIRTERLELTDHDGKVMGVLRVNPHLGTPELMLYNRQGRDAVALGVNDRGYGGLMFSSDRILGKVVLGYHSGADTPVPLDTEDPNGGWGMWVRGDIGKLYSFGAEADGRPLQGDSALKAK